MSKEQSKINYFRDAMEIFFSNININTASSYMDQTYNEAAKFILENFNLTKLGCRFYGLDFETAHDSEKNNAGKKIRSRLKTAKPKFMQELIPMLMPQALLLSDQQIEQLKSK